MREPLKGGQLQQYTDMIPEEYRTEGWKVRAFAVSHGTPDYFKADIGRDDPHETVLSEQVFERREDAVASAIKRLIAGERD